MKKYILLIFVLLIIPLALAEDQTKSTLVFKQNQLVDYHLVCLDQNNAYCSSGTQLLGNVWWPNGTQFYSNITLTYNPAFFNLTFPTSALGGPYKFLCVSPTIGNTSCEIDYFVTQTGTIISTGESNIYILLVILTLTIWVILFFFGFTLPYNNKRNEKGTITRFIASKYLKLFSLLFGYGSMLWFFNILAGLVNNFTTLSFIQSMVNNLFVFVWIVAYPWTILIMAAFIVEFYRDIIVLFMKKLLNSFFGAQSKT